MSNFFYNKFTLATRETIQNLVSRLKSGYDVTTLWSPGIGRSKFSEVFIKLCKTEDFRLAFDFPEIVFIYLDLSLSGEYFRFFLMDQLSLYSDMHGVAKMLRDISSKHKVVFVLDNIDLRSKDLLQYVLALRSFAPEQILYLHLFMEADFFDAEYQLLKESSFHYHILNISYYTFSEVQEWLVLNTNKKYSQSEVKQIYQFTGGVPLLLRKVIISQQKTLEDVFTSESMEITCKRLFSRYSKQVKDMLARISLGERVSKDKIFRLLQGQHLLNDKGVLVGLSP